MISINTTERRFNLTNIYRTLVNESPQRLTKFICGFCMCHSVCSNIWEVSFVTTLLILIPLTQKLQVPTNTHMLKKSRIFVNKISKGRQTTSNWIVRILNKATSAYLVWNILILLFVFAVFNTAIIGPYCNTKPESLILELQVLVAVCLKF